MFRLPGLGRLLSTPLQGDATRPNLGLLRLRRASPVVALLFLVTLAGCPVVEGDPEEDPEDESTPEPEPPTPEPDPVCGDGLVGEGEDCDDAGPSTDCDVDCTFAECGDGLANEVAGEECDDAGESALCDSDCSLAECGDGLVNEAAGEACDLPDQPWACSDCQPGSCAGATAWEQIAPSLTDYADLLPPLPDALLDTDWPDAVPALRLDSIRPGAREADWSPDPSSCDIAPVWTSERIDVGPLIPGDEELAPHCRVSFRSNPTDPSLFFLNRYPTGSGNIPITGEPAWVRTRFPIPEGHVATEFTWEYSWSRLFGSSPQACAEADQDEDGNCTTQFLAEDEDWSEDVPPGLFLLWGRGQDCDGWLITGPHEPAGTLSWSGIEQHTVAVPEAFHTVDELVVAALVYHQYPGGCEGTTCVGARNTYYSVALNGASLRTEEPFDPPELPPTEHPRLFGPDTEWLSAQAPFDNLPCRGAPDYHEGAGWGTVTNVRNLWDRYTKGGAVCLAEEALILEDHPDAAPYLDGGVVDDWDHDRALRALHLVRRTRACDAETAGPCQFSLAEIQPLVDALIVTELGRFDEWVWAGWPFGFDLRTDPTMRFWSIFSDVLWDDLTPEEHTQIADRMSTHIDAFLALYDETHWALYNGNNWTPVLAKAALYWAITWYHEDPRAPEVVWRALQVLWLHQDFYLEDGAYLEGLMMYTQVSFQNLRDVNALVLAAFGEPLASVRWERMPAVADWALAFTAPDGMTVDFGDSWNKRGWASLLPLYMKLHEELTDTAEAVVDPCFARAYFSNRYYDWGLRDPWSVDPSMARDWPVIVEDCIEDQAPSADGDVTILPEGGWGAIRVGRSGATDLAASASEQVLLYEQVDQTYLAVSAVPNARPHTEFDFGTLVWTAYGNRLLADMGYGSIGGGYETEPVPDNNPTGHNTLVVPEATLPGQPTTNASQIEDEAGTISLESIDGFEVLRLDGSAVYGRDDPALGWMEFFERRLLALSEGHFLVIDALEVRSDRPDSAVSEYWHSFYQEAPPEPANCVRQAQHVEQLSSTSSELLLLPVCSNLANTAAESAGRIVADSVEPGSFVVDAPFSFINRLNQTEWRARSRYVPDAPVRQDLRVFALLSATSEGELPSASIEHATCSAGLCFTVTVGGSSWELAFSDAASSYQLMAISPL